MRIAALALLVGCGDNFVLPDQLAAPYASGEVIRARELIAPDFATLIGWQDTDRNYSCSLSQPDGDCARPNTENRFSEESCSLPITLSDAFPLILRAEHYYEVGLPYHGLIYTVSGGSCSLDPVDFDGFQLTPVDRDELLQIRRPFIGTFGNMPYTATVTSDGSSLITDLGPDTVEDIAATPSRLRRVFRLAGGIRMLALSPPGQPLGSLPIIHDTSLDHHCHPAHQDRANGTIRCYPDSDFATETVFGNDQCMDVDRAAVTATSTGLSTHESGADGDGIPTVSLAFECVRPLVGVWFHRVDGNCVTLTEPRFDCDTIDPGTLADLAIEIE